MKKDDIGKIVGAYARALDTMEGELILEDLSVFCGVTPDKEEAVRGRMTHMAGAMLSHEECAYRNGQQDMLKYIQGMMNK